MTRFLAVFSLVFLSLPVAAQVADGDALWARRGEGARGAVASAASIEPAIAAYRKAVASDAGDLEARWKLMRALRFKAAYAAPTNEERKAILEEAKGIGAPGVAQLDALLAAKKGGSIARGSEETISKALRGVPNAGELLYWDAASWGEWAVAFGKLAAVRQGAADRIRRESTIVMLMDPAIESGGGARILGRLHNQTPRVPFITGWASDEKAAVFLEQSLELDPTNKLTKVFLAEALAATGDQRKARAVALLREVASARIDPAWAVEDAAAIADAKALLASWGD